MGDKNQKGVSTDLIGVAIVCLIIGGCGAYFFAYTNYEPKIDNLDERITGLELIVTESTGTVTKLELEKATYLSQISAMESDILDLEIEINDANVKLTGYTIQVRDLESEITSLKAQKRNLESEVRECNADIRDLEDQIEKMLDVKATQYYEWYFNGMEWTWTIHIPMSLYMEYYTRDRPRTQKGWINMADDPDDDYYIDSLVDAMERSARTERYNEVQMVNYVIAFVQSLPYTSDSATTGSDEYPRYPIETLFDRGGDCEDTSILTVALLNELGYDVALLIYDDHVAVGVVIDTYGTFYKYDGKKYFYLETTGEGWKIGEIPEGYEDAFVYPLN